MSCNNNECEYYYDGTFHVVKYPKGSKLYNGTRYNREFPIGKEFYTPVNIDTKLPDGYMKAVEDGNDPLSVTFAKFFNGNMSVAWYSDIETAKCNNCGIAAYILKKDAIFIDIRKSEDIATMIRPNTDSNVIGFFRWLCTGIDNERYAGYTLGKELFFCSSLQYLDRDLTDEKDWQYFNAFHGVTDDYMQQLKLYKTPNVNISAGNLYDMTVWTMMNVGDILSRPNKYVVLSFGEKLALQGAAFLSYIGYLDPQCVRRRKYDFVIECIPKSHVKKEIPIFTYNKNGDLNSTPKKSIQVEKLLDQLDVYHDSNIEIWHLSQLRHLLWDTLDMYVNKPKEAVQKYIDDVTASFKKAYPDITFIYSLLVLSIASIKAMQPPAEATKTVKGRSWSLINTPQKVRGGLVPSQVDNFMQDILQTFEETRGPPPTTSDIPADMWFARRITIGDSITDAINNIEISQWKHCMSGENAVDFKKKLTDPRFIGSGSYGQVYLAKIDLGNNTESKLVLKEAKLDQGEKKKLEPHKENAFPSKSWPKEFRMNSFTKDLLTKKKCPNFLNIYRLSVCEGCTVKKRVGTCYTTFMEAADGDVTSVLRSKLKDKRVQLSFLYQMLAALHVIQKEYGMIHRDIKQGNILVQHTPHLSGKYFKYVIDGNEYLVENAGIVFYLGDFGVAETKKPEWATGYNYPLYGERNAMVQRKTDGTLELIPITSKYMLDGKVKRPARKFHWGDGLSGTRNLADKVLDPEFNIPVDLSNTQVFPPFEFNDDIQDLLKVVASGKRSTQPNVHPGFGISPDVSALISPLIFRHSFMVTEWHADMAYQVLAGEMLKEIFVPPSTNKVEIIDTFIS